MNQDEGNRAMEQEAMAFHDPRAFNLCRALVTQAYGIYTYIRLWQNATLIVPSVDDHIWGLLDRIISESRAYNKMFDRIPADAPHSVEIHALDNVDELEKQVDGRKDCQTYGELVTCVGKIGYYLGKMSYALINANIYSHWMMVDEWITEYTPLSIPKYLHECNDADDKGE